MPAYTLVSCRQMSPDLSVHYSEGRDQSSSWSVLLWACVVVNDATHLQHTVIYNNKKPSANTVAHLLTMHRCRPFYLFPKFPGFLDTTR